MKVRSPLAFGFSLVLLAGAGALGGLMVHDGEVGTDEARLDYVAEGDPVTLKGRLVLFDVPDAREWQHIDPVFANTTYLLEGDDEHVVLVTGMPADLDGQIAKVDGTIVFDGPHPTASASLLVMHAESYTTPLLFR